MRLFLSVFVLLRANFATPAEDYSRYFPLRERTAVHNVEGHLLNNSVLPPGTLADYKTCQLFLARTASNEKAAFLLLDYKKTLTNPKYLPNMGGFFGGDASRQVYVFVKGPYFAGIVGLSQEKADPLAREFAARIPLK